MSVKDPTSKKKMLWGMLGFYLVVQKRFLFECVAISLCFSFATREPSMGVYDLENAEAKRT
jgi:hypothetical protein